MFSLTGKHATWAYIVARVKVMKRRLIPSEEYKKLLNMSFDEIVRYLEETEYKKEIDELAYKYSGPRLLDYALTLNLGRTYKKIQDVSFGLAREIITEYLRRWDIWNIITIIRGKLAGVSVEEIEEAIVPVGSYTIEFYRSLIPKELDEIVKTFEGTPYYEYLSKVGQISLSEIEDGLYKVYYQRILAEKPSELALKLFVDFIRMEIDIKNIKTILRLKREDTPTDEIMKRIIPGGFELTEDECAKLCAMSWDELTKSLEGYWFFKGIEGLEDDLSKVEIQFDKAWMQEVAKRASNYPLSILPVLQYMVLKKIEVDNLRTLGWGKWQNIPKEEIESQLVIL
jgi:V/A-type H+-transporting ATPase subunit C